SNQAIVGLYNCQKKTYEWQTPLLLTKENVPIDAFQIEVPLFIKNPRYLYKINLNNGNQEYQFDYRWGQVIP
ncbi:PA2928 family protein, partial [Enterococcus faecalis]